MEKSDTHRLVSEVAVASKFSGFYCAFDQFATRHITIVLAWTLGPKHGLTREKHEARWLVRAACVKMTVGQVKPPEKHITFTPMGGTIGCETFPKVKIWQMKGEWPGETPSRIRHTKQLSRPVTKNRSTLFFPIPVYVYIDVWASRTTAVTVLMGERERERERERLATTLSTQVYLRRQQLLSYTTVTVVAHICSHIPQLDNNDDTSQLSHLRVDEMLNAILYDSDPRLILAKILSLQTQTHKIHINLKRHENRHPTVTVNIATLLSNLWALTYDNNGEHLSN